MLSKINQEEVEFLEDLRNRDIRYLAGGIRPMPLVPALGRLDDGSSLINLALEEARTYGVEMSGLPVFKEPELPGSARVRLTKDLCGPDGIIPAGKVLNHPHGKHLVQIGAARAA